MYFNPFKEIWTYNFFFIKHFWGLFEEINFIVEQGLYGNYFNCAKIVCDDF